MMYENEMCYGKYSQNILQGIFDLSFCRIKVVKFTEDK